MLEDYKEGEYEFIFSHQKDKRPFNRGAMKNLGFHYAKQKYPNNYQNITFVFNDVDTMPGKKGMFNYETSHGTIKHFYGYTFALGGLFSITGKDFESLNGFPNYWAWGFEDNCIAKRAAAKNIKISRSQFYPVNHMDVLQFQNGFARKMDNMVTHKFKSDDGTNGINKIFNIKYEENVSKLNSKDNMNMVMVDYTAWTVPEKPEDIVYETRKNPGRVAQRKVNMGNLIQFMNKKK
jgi:hypothetical protein